MKDKIIKKVPIDDGEKIAAHYTHFGYTLKETRQEGHSVVLEFYFESNEHEPKLNVLYKQYKSMNKKFPTATVVWLVLAAILFGFYLYVPNIAILKPYHGFFIVPPIICIAVAVYLAILFVTILFNKKKIIDKIYLTADRLTGRVRDLPTKENIAPTSEYTNQISKNIKNIIKNSR